MKYRGTSTRIRVYASGLVPLTTDERGPGRWEVQVCRMWLRLFARPRARINPKVSSHGIQLLINEWASLFTHRTVTNGAVIQAALEEGYAMRRVRLGDLDAQFDVTLGLWTRFESRARP